MSGKMTPLERLADWITGGGLRARDEEMERLGNLVDAYADEIVTEGKGHRIAREWAENMTSVACETRRALTEIAAMETPRANATVRRMAARAREAL